MITAQQALELYKKENPWDVVKQVNECELFYAFEIDHERCKVHVVTGGATIIYKKSGRVGCLNGKVLAKIHLTPVSGVEL